jgi:hypothetical protein
VRLFQLTASAHCSISRSWIRRHAGGEIAERRLLAIEVVLGIAKHREMVGGNSKDGTRRPVQRSSLSHTGKECN